MDQTNSPSAASSADWSDAPSADLTPFQRAVDSVLNLTAHLAREVVGAHQGAATLIINGDWKTARKYFSLSSKYENWFEYRAKASGVGTHTVVVEENHAVRMTQSELEKHPKWMGFGTEASTHPPMRGWLAVPLIGPDKRNYGLLQLSDKYNDADFTAEDEAHLQHLASLTAIALDALGALHGDRTLGH